MEISNKAYYKNQDSNTGNFKDILKERFQLPFTSIKKRFSFVLSILPLLSEREQ